MSIAVITGSSGLIGSEATRFFHEKGLDIIGIDNNMRKYFFGQDGDTSWNRKDLEKKLKHYAHKEIDIRNKDKIRQIFKRSGKNISVVIHCAAQPSHDWAAREPATDFGINALGTLNVLEATRKYSSRAVFIFTSTNKVYGDTPNNLPLIEKETRWEVESNHPFAKYGIDESMSIDQSKHSIFGASKVAADILVQEYGRYFGLKTVAFRGGCLTGPAHSGAELHGFLAYLVKCAVTGKPYTIYGYKGKQVRDNIHSFDLITAFWSFFQNPRYGEVYNIGGSRHSHGSLLEAIEFIQNALGKKIDYTLSDRARSGDHIWWISDVRKFQSHYPEWKYKYDISKILNEIIDFAKDRF
ncbi:MAG: NAD-dependent epimerase/dehydratase family protein [Spirochaetes bacterium]|nr:NAD-dependent epimerase/dehydratase family protein [Spirochaetota bacterium]